MCTGSLVPPENQTDEGFKQFTSGSRRSKLAPRYDLIPVEGYRRLANRYELGLKKYTRDNWKKGLSDPEFLDQLICHMIEHIEHYKAYRQAVGWNPNVANPDDDMAAIAWGAFTLMEAEALLGPK